MLGIVVTVNGQWSCKAAVPEKSQLQATIVFGARFGNPEISVTGVVQKPAHISEYPIWAKRRLTVGDHVLIELAEINSVDEPIESSTYDFSADFAEQEKRIEAEANRLRKLIDEGDREAILEPPETREGPFCSFCGKEKNEVKRLIEGPSIYICDECLRVSNDILTESHKSKEQRPWSVHFSERSGIQDETGVDMLGLRIAINGTQVCVAAVPGNNQLDAAVIVGGSFKQPTIWVNGYIEKTEHISERLTFGNQHLAVGDRVGIELVGTRYADQPIETSTVDCSGYDRGAGFEKLEKLIAKSRVIAEGAERRSKEPEAPRSGDPAMEQAQTKRLCCSFCGKGDNEVTRLIAGPSVYICNECVEACNELVAGQ